MKTITFNPATSWSYDEETKKYMVSERDVPFDTSYMLEQDGRIPKMFNFSHSTGSEFNPNTRWVYKTVDGFILEVCNDEQMTKKAARDYLAAKTRNC